MLGWGSTYGPIGAAVKRVRRAGHQVAQAHLHYLNPFPRNTGEVLRSYDKILIPEMNLGQLLKLVRAEFLVDAIGYNRVRGHPVQGVRARRGDHRAGGVVRPKKKTPDQRGLLLKERPFSYRARRDGTVEILWKGRRATTLAGKIAERFLEVAPTEDEQGQQLLMAKATGNFKRGNEGKR